MTERDIIERLRTKGSCFGECLECLCEVGGEAAEEIERLRELLAQACDYLYNPFEPDNQSSIYKQLKAEIIEQPKNAEYWLARRAEADAALQDLCVPH